ncbi:MAG: START-like domain-containing protein [Chitinophagales bacterium]
MARIKYTLDYVIKSSPSLLYSFLTNPSDLARWFADAVDKNDKIYSFYWGGQRENASILQQEEKSFIRLQFEDNEDGEFLEFRIEKSPITGDTVLIITDFSDSKADMDDEIKLWNAQVKVLTGKVGGGN